MVYHHIRNDQRLMIYDDICYIYIHIWLTPPIWEWFIETIYGEMMINDDD